MATTQLFVELLVIGFGTLAWLGLFAAAFLGYDPAQFYHGVLSVKALPPVSVAVYVLGIVTDWVADRLFERRDARLRRRYFGADQARYFDARRTLMVYGPALWEHLEYGRSRLRICRGWALNAALLPVSLDVLAFARRPTASMPWEQVVVYNLGLGLFGVLCAYCWRALTEKEYSEY